MTKYIFAHNLELLKSKVQFLSGLENLSPADCKIISSLIHTKTKYYVSETTIKRIYGFAISKFSPSLYTLDALSVYCDCSGWDDFCNHQLYNSKNISPENADWFALQQNTSKTSKFTIDALKSKTGIPYNKTIKRVFIDDHLKRFTESSQTGTIICAPAGYGKSISLCHWVEQQVELNQSKANNDIILFFSAGALANVLLLSRDINYWMLGLLGYTSDNDINVLWDEKQRKDNKFYLIVDGLDEHHFKNENFMLLLRQIMDIASLHQANPWMKVILSMRSYSWINHRHELDPDNNFWMTNFYNTDDCINVPLFSNTEIARLCNKINPELHQFNNIQLSEPFNQPLYFQYYYKLHKDDFSLENLDHIAAYELIYAFVMDKICSGPYSSDKLLFIRELIKSMCLHKEDYLVSKLKIYNTIKNNQSVYLDLLSIDLIREVNKSKKYEYNTVVKFSNAHFTNLSIAITLLSNNQNLFNAKLINDINKQFENNPLKLYVLKWCLLHAVKTGQLSSIVHVTDTHLSPNEKTKLVVFLSELLSKHMLKQADGSMLHYFEEDINQKLFDYFLGAELFNNEYKIALKNLLQFDLSNRKKIIVYSLLAALAVINLELDNLNLHIQKLKSFPTEDVSFFEVNPLDCLDAIYHYLKYGVVKKEPLVSLTKFIFTPPSDENRLKNCAENDLLYLLGMYTLLICDNPQKSLRYINAVESVYKTSDLSNKTSAYAFFVKTILTDTYFRLGDHHMVTSLYYTIANAFKKMANSMSPYMKTVFLSCKIKLLLSTSKDHMIISELQHLTTSATQSGSKITMLVILTLLLNNERFLATYPDFYKQLYFDYKKIVNQCGINTSLLSSHYNLVYK